MNTQKSKVREVIRTLMESPYYFDPPRGYNTPGRLALVKRVLELKGSVPESRIDDVVKDNCR